MPEAAPRVISEMDECPWKDRVVSADTWRFSCRDCRYSVWKGEIMCNYEGRGKTVNDPKK